MTGVIPWLTLDHIDDQRGLSILEIPCCSKASVNLGCLADVWQST